MAWRPLQWYPLSFEATSSTVTACPSTFEIHYSIFDIQFPPLRHSTFIIRDSTFNFLRRKGQALSLDRGARFWGRNKGTRTKNKKDSHYPWPPVAILVDIARSTCRLGRFCDDDAPFVVKSQKGQALFYCPTQLDGEFNGVWSLFLVLQLFTAVNQLLTKLYTSLGVDVEQVNGGTTGRCLAYNDCITSLEVLVPVVDPRMKQPHNLVCIGVD